MTPKVWDGDQKQIVREMIFSEGLRFKKTLWLTGYELRDLQLAQKSGFLSPNAEITIVERDRKTYRAICENQRVLFPQASVIHGTIESQRFGPVDFVNLDFCGSLTQPLSQWMSEIIFIPGASIYINLCYSHRASFFMGDAEHLLNGTCSHLVSDASVSHRIIDNRIASQICLLKSIFRNHRFELLPPIFYRDRINPMTTYRLTDMQSCRPVYPDLLPLLKGDACV